ncbi:tetratricopeptide repeat protein [Paenibacillus sp. FSL R7-0273]|uniref:tetratricopeptide repeat protein n=1 Tax=Paenibacillus sp. FSL R7-0273 TaxID=1536772 RepID=UPI0006938EE8|nr:tetratricopeptide repeat protein [Paenibacillus sp. FSL R7-0273]OMF84144.1 hypothetical protein BK144_30735 [Paenibacillus sp. FSL R7-0273]
MNSPQLLIASPIRQKPEILSLFLHSLGKLNTAGLGADYMFVDDNTDPASSRLLHQFARRAGGAVTIVSPPEEGAAAYLRDDDSHRWPEAAVWRVAAMKDQILQAAVDADYTHVFLADSDLLFHPQTLKALLDCGKELVSAIFWTRWQTDTMEMPQVWLHSEYGQHPLTRREELTPRQCWSQVQSFYAKLRRPGLHEVGGLGACTLISRQALLQGVRFAEIPNLGYWGEDRHFCVRAAALGLQMFVETTYPAYHIYRSSDLAGCSAFFEACSQAAQAAGSDLEIALEYIHYGYDEAAAQRLEQFLMENQGSEDEQVTALLELDACYGRLGDTEKGLVLLTKAAVSCSRAELSFRIGAKWMDQQAWEEALRWLKQALAAPRPAHWETLPGKDTWTWKPCIQLCVCYSRLGSWQTAYEYNEQGLTYNPDHPVLLTNRSALLDKLGSAEMQSAIQETG